MAKIDEFLDNTICTLEEANDYEGQGPSDSQSSRTRGVKRSASAGKLNPGSKRQHRDDSEDPEQSDNEEGNDQTRGQKRKKTVDDPRRLACPFFKFDPQRYKEHRTCCGPGWTEMHRVKEHLYRHHLLFTCSRCFEHFKSEKLLQTHMRARVACTWKDDESRIADPGAGIDQNTEKQLKARRPGKHEDDAVAKWYEVYHILFPGKIDAKDMPSPWYDTPNSGNGSSVDDNMDLKRQYECFLRREIPQMIRRELEAYVEKEFQDVSKVMQGRLTNWIQTSAERCANIFKYIPTPTEAAAQPDPEAVRAGSSRAGSPVPESAFSCNIGEDFVAWPFDFPPLFDLDFSHVAPPAEYPADGAQAYGQCLQSVDSAYGSGSVGESSGTWRCY